MISYAKHSPEEIMYVFVWADETYSVFFLSSNYKKLSNIF